MSKCFLCQRDNIGFMSGFSMSGLSGKICDQCHREILKIRNASGDGPDTAYFSDLLNKVHNRSAKEYLQNLLRDANIESMAKSQNIPSDNASDLIDNIVDSILISTTSLIDGHAIAEYKNIVTGISVLGTGFFNELNANVADLLGSSSSAMESKIASAKDSALFYLKREAYDISCNAVIGVSISFVPFSGNMIGLVASGTAVIVE